MFYSVLPLYYKKNSLQATRTEFTKSFFLEAAGAKKESENFFKKVLTIAKVGAIITNVDSVNTDICGSAGIGRQARLRGVCL